MSIAWRACRQLGFVVVASLLFTGSVYAQDVLACGQLVQPASGPTFAPRVTPGTNLVSMGNVVYFISGDETGAGATPNVLWRTNGTPTGTFTITPPIANFTPLYLFTAVNGTVFMRATTPATGAELWISDGTAQGTQLLKDVTPGPADTTYQSSWFALAERLFFAVYTESEPIWWTTDGTPEGTVPVETIYPGVIPENASLFAQSATEAYLLSRISEKQVDLWHWDSNGFTKVKEFLDDVGSEDVTTIGQSIMRKGNLYFFADIAGGPSGLWRSDGRPAGTQLIIPQELAAQDNPASESGVYPYTLLTTERDDLFFFEYDQPLLRLWRLDDTSDTAVLVKTIRIRNEDGLYYDIQFDQAIAYGSKIYFSLRWRDDRLNLRQSEVWTSDGTAIGTYRLTSLPVTAQLAFGVARGLFLLGDPYVVYIPWVRPYPTVICNLGSHVVRYPTLFYHQGSIYVSGRNAPSGTEYLWRLDPTTFQLTHVFLPQITK